MEISLACVGRTKIKHKRAGLTEPSGVALAADGARLWTVSDDTGRILALTMQGSLEDDHCFDVPDTGLEGISIHPDGRTLFAVREENNEVIVLNAASRSIISRRRLVEMAGFEAIAQFFDDGDRNKGLEGVAWSPGTQTLVCLKEGEPGLLIEIDLDLAAIMGHTRLGRGNGFVDPDARRTVDFSDICHDKQRDAFWIVSDKARRAFLYSKYEDQVLGSAPLTYTKGKTRRRVKKAEGVAHDPATDRLYVVSDDEARLYVFAVQSM